MRSIPKLNELLGHTSQLGARHIGYGVRVADYHTVGEALLAVLASALGDAFDPATREARTTAYSLAAETMLQGAAAAGMRPGDRAHTGHGQVK